MTPSIRHVGFMRTVTFLLLILLLSAGSGTSAGNATADDPECDRCLMACFTEYDQCTAAVNAQYNAQCVQSDMVEKGKCELERFEKLQGCYLNLKTCLERCPNIKTRCLRNCDDRLFTSFFMVDALKFQARLRNECRGLRPNEAEACAMRVTIGLMRDMGLSLQSAASCMKKCCNN